MPTDHATEAKRNPKAYAGTITKGNEILSIVDAANEMGDMPPIVHRFGYWTVCSDCSIQCLFTYYCITVKELDGPYWVDHVCEKTWVYCPDFKLALETAKAMRDGA